MQQRSRFDLMAMNKHGLINSEKYPLPVGLAFLRKKLILLNAGTFLTNRPALRYNTTY